MTISSTVSRTAYAGSGTTGPFAYPFRIFAATDLRVIRTLADTTQVEHTYPADFSVTGIGSTVGGTITLSDELATGETLTIRRRRPLKQETDVRNQGDFYPASYEDALDHGTMVDQQQQDELDRSIKLAETDDPSGLDLTLPPLVPLKALVVNATGDGFDMGDLSAVQLTAWSASENKTLDIFTGGVDFTAGVSTQLTLSGDPGNEENCTVTRRTSGTVVFMHHDEFTVVGTTLTFGAVIPSGTTQIEVGYLQTYQVNRMLAQNVPWTQAGAGAVARDVRARLRDTISVRDFGATGDGVTDDTAAINAAITAAAGKTLDFPEGTYKVTSLQSFTGAVGTRFDGRNRKAIIAAATDISIWTFDATCTDLIVDGLVFAGQSVSTAAKFALDLHGPRCIVHNCYVHDFNQGVKINDEDASDCLITGNLFKDIIGATSGNGYAVYNIAQRTIITGNHFDTVGRHDVYLSGSSPAGSKDCVVANNTSKSNGIEAIALYNVPGAEPVSGCIITGNTIIDPGDTGIGLDQNATDNVVSGNVIRNAGNIGIFLNGSTALETYPDRNVICGNLVVDAVTAPIKCINGSGNLFSGNIVANVSAAAVTGITVTSTGSPATWPHDNVIAANSYLDIGAPAIGVNAGVYYGLEHKSYDQRWVTFADGDTTPSVAGTINFIVDNSAPTTITDFDDKDDGQEIFLVFSNGNTTISTANIFLAGGVNFTPTASDTLTLVRRINVWFEKCRSVN